MTRETQQGHPEDVSVPVVARMPKTPEEVDVALLAEARRLLGGDSPVETINLSLARLIREERRRQAAEAQLRRCRAGQFAGLGRPEGRS